MPRRARGDVTGRITGGASRRASRRTARTASLVAVLVLAGTLGVIPGGPTPNGATAASRERVPTRAAKLLPAGRALMGTIARQRTVGRSTSIPVPARLGWQRPGHRAPAGGTTDSQPFAGAMLVTAADATAADATDATATTAVATAAVLGTAATGGPGVVGTAWAGLTDQAIPCGSSRPCVEPPDPWVAVSSTHVIQMAGNATRISDRAGGAVKQVSNRDFFGVNAWNTGAFAADPRVLYDPVRDRWVATLFAGTCSGGALFVAVSDTGNPAGAWRRSFLPFAGTWPDFPTLGFSSALVVVGVNEFGVACGAGSSYVVGAYQGASLVVMDWSDLLDGDGPKMARTTDPNPAAFTYVPAVGLTAGDAVHAVVALDDGSTSTADLGYASIAGTISGGDLAIAPPARLAVPATAKLRQPPAPVDAGGLIGVQRNALDLRPTDAVWRDGRLAVASTTACPWGTAYRPCGRVVELTTRPDLAAPTLRQDVRISPTAGNSDTFMPGVGYSDDGTLWTVFSQSSAKRYVSSWARRQVPAAPPGTWSPGAALIAAGRGPYGGTAGAGLNERWGDYVGVARDPAAPASVWQANQVADTGGGWATRVARLGDDTTPPVLASLRPGFIAGATAGRTAIPVRISWSTSDAGSGVAAVALQRSVNGGAWTTVAGAVAPVGRVTQTVAYGTRYAFRLMATDQAGNASAWSAVMAFRPVVYSEGSTRVAYRGAWTGSRNTSYLGGKARYASVAWRRATFTFSGLAVAWVSTKSRTRGRARVYGDGVLQGSYSTYRSTRAYRRVITGRTFPAAGPHTYRIEVVGTAGHPRVDLDAFVVLR